MVSVNQELHCAHQEGWDREEISSRLGMSSPPWGLRQYFPDLTAHKGPADTGICGNMG